MATTDKMTELETLIGYKFGNSVILQEALQAPGAPFVFALYERQSDGNKRLAVLGDAILKLVLVDTWYFTSESRGRANQIVSDVGSNANLDRIGRRHGLERFINRNPSQGLVISPATMTATVEAIIGAAYVDGDLKAARDVMDALNLTSN